MNLMFSVNGLQSANPGAVNKKQEFFPDICIFPA
jgi:hypothetical protein